MKAFRWPPLRLASFIIPALLLPAGLMAQKVTRIEIMNSDLTAYDIKIGKDARKLLGNVRLKHEDVLMSCDSAYFYPGSGSVDAFSRVRIEQADTLTLTGDVVYYDGNRKLARIRNNVKLVNNDIVLLSDSLNYNRETRIADYLGWGILTQADSRLTSKRGRFYVDQEVFFFQDSVHISNPDYRIRTDSLRYDTKTEISYFNGPTEIYSDDRYIYCESGWYDTKNDISYVNKKAFLEEEGRTLRGDTLYYDAVEGYGYAKGQVEMMDTSQHVTMKGHYGLYYSENEYAMVTDSALMIQIDGSDTMYIHADTLLSTRHIAESGDTSRILRAYYKVKIFRPDMQVMCDSLAYPEADSTFHFYGEPVLWSDENQLSADQISVMMKNRELYRMEMTGISLVVTHKEGERYDQMRGKEMRGHFVDNKLSRIDVTGNGQTIYYAEEEEEIIGANKTLCSSLTIYLKDNKVVRVSYLEKPDGTYYPLDKFPGEESRLSDFKWVAEWRPLVWQDVFWWKEKKEP